MSVCLEQELGGGKEGIPDREISMDKRAEVKCSWPILEKNM